MRGDIWESSVYACITQLLVKRINAQRNNQTVVLLLESFQRQRCFRVIVRVIEIKLRLYVRVNLLEDK